jgi:hypothetical protein
MNGRVYDYNVGRFLSVDPFIHGSGSQGINPYSYILNNPLAGTDPTGYKPCTDMLDNHCGDISFDTFMAENQHSVNFGKEGLGLNNLKQVQALWNKIAEFDNAADGERGAKSFQTSGEASSIGDQSSINKVSKKSDGADLTEKNNRHSKAVKLHVAKLKKQGFVEFEYDVRINIDLGNGESAIRYADIAAIRKGQTLAEAEFHEIKSVQKKRKNTVGRSLLRKVSRFEDIKEIVTKIQRGATMVNQLRKDATLSEYGGFIPRSGERLEPTMMKWSIYQYEGKKMKQAGRTVSVFVGNPDIQKQVEEHFLQ